MKNSIHTIVVRSVAGPFYRQHAGAFLFLFLILFGIQPSFNDAFKVHYAFITGILTSTNFFLVALGCWLLYTFKIISFFRSCLQKEAYDFIFELNSLSDKERYIQLLKLCCVLLAPVAAYGLVIVGIAITDRHLGSGLLVIATIVILHLLTALVSNYLLKKAKAIQQVISKKQFFPFPKTIFGFVLKFIFRRQFIALLIIKILSFSCLYFFVRTEASVFEERMLWLLFLTALTGHAIIVYKNFHFLEGELGFHRNLPLRPAAIILSLLAVYSILLLPEAWALRALIVNKDTIGEYVWMILTGPCILLLLHGLLYTEDMKMEEFLKLLFGVWVVFVFFSLSKNHWILPAISFVFGLIIFRMSYYQYEKNTEVEGLE